MHYPQVTSHHNDVTMKEKQVVAATFFDHALDKLALSRRNFNRFFYTLNTNSPGIHRR